jgi:hypothetical protein
MQSIKFTSTRLPEAEVDERAFATCSSDPQVQVLLFLLQIKATSLNGSEYAQADKPGYKLSDTRKHATS